MSRIIAALNMTLDGFCDHTAGVADEELHRHYTQLIGNADAILYGRTTYELMTYWQTLLKQPSAEKSMNDFAAAIDHIPKIVFSHALKNLSWDSATLASQPPEKTATELRQRSTRDILIGSRSLIIQLMNLDLIDEYQICVHPVVIGKGLPLFDKINDRTLLKLLKTKTFGSGAILLHYQRA